jgi:type I restriction enzyme, S subunit
VTWSVVRLDWLTSVSREVVDPSALGDTEVAHYSIPALDTLGGPVVEPASSIASTKLRIRGGEVLVSKLNPRKLRVTITEPPDRLALASGEFIPLIPTGVETRFLSYWLRSERTRQDLDAATQSVTRSHQRVTPEVLTKKWLRIPDRQTQRAISDFLDERTGRIDTMLEKKWSLIDRLDEYIDARIRLSVGQSSMGGGPAPTVELRSLLTPVDRPVRRDAGMITAYRDGQVILRSERRAEGYTDAWTDSEDVKGVIIDDVVIHGLDGFAGSIGSSESEGACSPVYHVCTPTTGDPLYLGRMLRVLALDDYLGLFATSTRQRAVDLRNWNLVGRIPVPSVPVSEQREVAEKIRKLRPLRRAVALSAERAAEHRQALITAAVTGELEVPGVAA